MRNIAIGVVLTLSIIGASHADSPGKNTFQVAFDGGTCVVKKDAWPSVGSGCHVQYDEQADDGTIVESVVVLECGQLFKVCGEMIHCSCTPTPKYR